jgi:hypothetical protein
MFVKLNFGLIKLVSVFKQCCKFLVSKEEKNKFYVRDVLSKGKKMELVSFGELIW